MKNNKINLDACYDSIKTYYFEFHEIQNKVDNLKGIPRIQFLLSLSDKKRTEFFEYKKFLETQHFLLGGTDYE